MPFKSKKIQDVGDNSKMSKMFMTQNVPAVGFSGLLLPVTLFPQMYVYTRGKGS
jgi:hypothetical protein